MRIFLYIINLSCILLIPSVGLAEYIRATNQEEIILLSTESEVRMGKSLSKSVEEKFTLDEDTALQKRINDIGQEIASICDRKDIKYHFKILKGEELEQERRINAFALPGGYIYIFKDMVKLMESDDEIAGILAHEVGHVAAKHSVKRLQSYLGAMAFQLLSSGLSLDNETRRKAHNAITLLMLSYSREDEAMADKLSVRYAKKAGYDPKAIISSIDKMIDRHKRMPIKKYSAYQTHPYLSERKAMVKKEIYGRMDFVDFINIPTALGEK